MRARPLPLLVVLSLSLLAGPAEAIKLSASKDTWLDLHLLIQPWLQARTELGKQPGQRVEFYLRRTRLVVGGQVTKWVSFFAETDQPNWGKGGDWNPAFFVQDAYVSFNLHRALSVDGGLILIPFVHQARQGATSLHTLDYHCDLIRYPAGSHKVWRDAGAELRGLLLGDRLSYTLAVTNGVSKPPRGVPRFSGRLALNAFDAEEGFFLAGTYLGAKRVFSAGVAFDTQPEAFGEGTSYLALGADLFLDLPLRKKRRLSGQLDLVYYGGSGNPDRGVGLLFDLGLAAGRVEPLVAFDWFRPEGASELRAQLFGWHAGLNLWLFGHTANLKADLGFIKNTGVELWRSATVFTLQTQLFL